ncbi:MoaD/ThiS family protein [Chloroflexota bacterium]
MAGTMAGTMVVSIEFSGIQRVVTQTYSIDMPITEKTMVNDALEYVRRQYPALRLDEGMILISVNQEKASPNRVLRANDTISFLPFISGG